MHRACLDVADRTVPQPEALHNNDHAVGELFARELRDLTVDDIYEIRLPMLMEGKRAELLSYASEATNQIRNKWPAIASGSGLKGCAGNKWWWAFHKLPKWDREDTAQQGYQSHVGWTGAFL
jgi:hypothetical protein